MKILLVFGVQVRCPVRILHGAADTVVPPFVASEVVAWCESRDVHLTMIKVRNCKAWAACDAWVVCNAVMTMHRQFIKGCQTVSVCRQPAWRTLCTAAARSVTVL